jgi:hypothetical protein
MLARVVAAAVVPQSAAVSPGTFVVGWRPPPFGTRHSVRGSPPRPDLDQLLLQACLRRVLDRLRCCKRAEKVAKIVGERMKLEPHGVGRERSARQPCPLDRALAFLDPLFARPAPIVENRRADKARRDAIRLWRSPGAAWSSSRLVGEIGMESTHLVQWSSDWALEQVADPMLEDLVGR